MRKVGSVLVCMILCVLLSAAFKANADVMCGTGVGVTVEKYVIDVGVGHYLELKVVKPKGRVVTVKGAIGYKGKFHISYEEMVPQNETEHKFRVYLDAGVQNIDFNGDVKRSDFYLYRKEYEYCE